MARSRLAGALLCFGLISAACTGGRAPPPPPADQPVGGGGTLRVGATWVLMDPHIGYNFAPAEAILAGWELMRCCLLRTLMAYPGVPGDRGGALPVPDLATGPPGVSTDGLTWTFRLKDGIHYAPPLDDVEVVAQDVVRALERAGNPVTAADGYGPIYAVIEGFEAFSRGEADTISGLEAPDDHTLIVGLTAPTGDLAARFALPVTAPIPADPFDPTARLGVAQDHPFTYGRYLVASGPYMFEGSGDVDFSVPGHEREPPAGSDLAHIALVRNPSWDPSTDDVREAIPDRIEVVFGFTDYFGGARVSHTDREIAELITADGLDLSLGPRLTPDDAQALRDDPATADRLQIYPIGATHAIAMNLAVPPFDDIHVRRAMNLAIDRSRLLERWQEIEGRTAQLAGHIGVDSHEGYLLAAYAPFGTDGGRGDLDLAAAEMARSSYDVDGDGRCDHPSCQEITVVDRFSSRRLASLIAEDLRPLGMRLDPLGPEADCYGPEAPTLHIGLCLRFGWIADYPDGASHLAGIFEGARIECLPPLNTANCGNFSLLGATQAQLETWGYGVTTVPSVDDRLARCDATSGRQRFACWAELDTYLMEEVVPWVPLFVETLPLTFSSRVEQPVPIAELTRLPALDRVRVEGEDVGPLPRLATFDELALPDGESGLSDGVYVTTITEEDALRAGMAPRSTPEQGPLWYSEDPSCVDRDEAICVAGTYRLIVDGRSWELRTDSPVLTCLNPTPIGEPPAFGRFRVAGREVTFRFGFPPCDATFLVIRTSSVGDELRIRLIAETPGTEDLFDRLFFEAHPWTNVTYRATDPSLGI